MFLPFPKISPKINNKKIESTFVRTLIDVTAPNFENLYSLIHEKIESQLTEIDEFL